MCVCVREREREGERERLLESGKSVNMLSLHCSMFNVHLHV